MEVVIITTDYNERKILSDLRVSIGAISDKIITTKYTKIITN